MAEAERVWNYKLLTDEVKKKFPDAFSRLAEYLSDICKKNIDYEEDFFLKDKGSLATFSLTYFEVI